MKRPLLISFIVALAIGSLVHYYNVFVLDEKYTGLIEDGTNQLKVIQRLTFDSNRSYFLLFMAVAGEADDKKHVEEYNSERLAITERNSFILDSLLESNKDPDLKKQIVKVMASRNLYREKTAELIQLTAIDKSKPIALLASEIDPLFSTYQRDINNLFTHHRNHIYFSSTSLSSEALWKANLTLLLSIILPVVLVVLVSLSLIILIYYHSKDWIRERT